MTTNPVDLLNTVMNARVSRRTLFKGAGIAGAGLLMSRLGLLRSVLAESETATDIINIAATAESLAVTLLGGAVQSAKQGGYDKPIPDVVIAILDAARAEEEFHLEYLLKAGAKPLTQTFTVPDPALLTSYNKLFSTIVAAETAFIAAYIAAAREFAAMNQPELVKVAFQIAGTEAEHRVLANYALGTRPANDVAFEKALFTTVGQAADFLKQQGFLGGSGTQVTYPGPGQITAANVTVQQPTGPSVSCTAGAPTPPAMPGITAPAQPKPGAAYFKETGHNVSGAFLSYWQAFGGLAIFGYPLTEEMQENGLTVQYFERSRFELHPGAAPQRYDVLLGLVGREVTAGRENEAPFRPLPRGDAPVWNGGMVPDSVEIVYFPQTGHYLGHGFLRYWQKFGGLEIFGFPISEEFREQNPDNGKTYVVQYFERARLEWHPGEWPERWDIMLGRLGAQVLNKRYGVPYP